MRYRTPEQKERMERANQRCHDEANARDAVAALVAAARRRQWDDVAELAGAVQMAAERVGSP